MAGRTRRNHNSIPSGDAPTPPRIPLSITRERAIVAQEQTALGYRPAQARRIAAWFVPWEPPPVATRGRHRRTS